MANPGTPTGAGLTGAPLLVSTGCTSADHLLAPVLAELHRRGRLGSVSGIGGRALQEQGAQLFFDTSATSSMGLFAGLRAGLGHARELLSAYRQFQQHLRRRPGLVVLVDNPGHNLRLLGLARRQAVPVLYYAPPEVWSIWRRQARAIARQAAAVVPLFRREARAYLALGADAHWLGHPLVDLLAPLPPRPSVDSGAPVVGLFPGSRPLEVAELLSVLRDAAILLRRAEPRSSFLVCSANAVVEPLIREHLAGWPIPVTHTSGPSHAVLAQCDLLLTCSGTATLEAALLDVPLVAAYRLHYGVDRLLARFLPTAGYRFIALPNCLVGREVVPEFFGRAVCPRRLAEEGLALLRDADRRREVRRGLAEARSRLGPAGAIARTADLVEEFLHVEPIGRRRPWARKPVARPAARR